MGTIKTKEINDFVFDYYKQIYEKNKWIQNTGNCYFLQRNNIIYLF